MWSRHLGSRRGVPVAEHAGIICTGETYKAVVKLTFAKGAALDDPARRLGRPPESARLLPRRHAVLTNVQETIAQARSDEAIQHPLRSLDCIRSRWRGGPAQRRHAGGRSDFAGQMGAPARGLMRDHPQLHLCPEIAMKAFRVVVDGKPLGDLGVADLRRRVSDRYL